MTLRSTTRLAYLAGALICAGLLAFALYLQHYEYQNPCPLCVLQRVVFIAMMVAFLMAAAHGPARIGAYFYSALLVALSLAGIAVAGRHVWLQHLPKDRVPECGPGLSYMLDRFPLFQAFEKIFRGSGECAEATWSLLGLSIAEWSLLWLALLGAYAALIAIRAGKMSRAR